MGAEPPTGVFVNKEQLLALAVDLARDAGMLLLERFDGGHERALASKSTPTDLVSEADLASERLIRERLSQARPATPTACGRHPRGGGGR